MRRGWRIWLLTTFSLSIYVAAAFPEGHIVETTVRLEKGYVASINIVRLADDPILMSLVFPQSNRVLPELGFPGVAKPWPASEEKRYLRPGSEIRLRVTTGSESVTYEAEPASAIGAQSRTLTNNPSTAPGVWRWPPPVGLPKIVLGRGVTKLTVEVALVEEPLAGQSARLLIYPPLLFKRPKTDIGWVGLLAFGAYFWPLIAIFQAAWAIALVVVSFARL
jgi:hypothetical protein